MTAEVLALSLGWGCLAAAPFVAWGARAATRGRASGLRRPPERVAPGSLGHPLHGPARVGVAVRTTVRSVPGVASVPRVVRGALALRRARREDARLRAEIPVAIDLIGVAAGAGCTPYLALETAAAWAPPAVAGHLGDVSRACSLGVSLADALAAKGRDVPLLRPLADALGATVRLGAPIGDALARLADEGRATLRREAETRARTMSVRLLFPLVLCVLPAFGLLTVVPAVLAGLRRV